MDMEEAPRALVDLGPPQLTEEEKAEFDELFDLQDVDEDKESAPQPFIN